MGLLKFLIIAICVLWLLRMVARVLLPALFRKVVKKAQQRANEHQQQQRRPEPEGRIRVDYIPPKDKEALAADKAGEFVDYEEIKH